MNSDMASRGWDIRPLTEEDIEAYLDIYLNSYPAYKALDAECRAHYRAKHLTELREDTQTRTVGLFEDGTLIATMKLILFSMNFFGRMQPACGLMALEVHPLHKKKGAALAMVRYFEDYARQNGALLTLLLPFRIDFYRRMGYGFAGKLYEYRLPTSVLPKPDATLTRPWPASAASPPGITARWRSSMRSCAPPGMTYRCGAWAGMMTAARCGATRPTALKAPATPTIPRTASAWRSWSTRTARCCAPCWAA